MKMRHDMVTGIVGLLTCIFFFIIFFLLSFFLFI